MARMGHRDHEEMRETAQEAGRDVARFEVKEGHTEPRNWEKDGEPYAGAYSHLAAVGFSRLGTRMYVLAFVDAYRSEFDRLQSEKL